MSTYKQYTIKNTVYFISIYPSRQNKNNYDHIVPLNLFGLNDVTNIQLLCEECNMKKLDKNYSTSQFYEKWY
ncbi:HNH endonuclease [Carnobacterium maltaromaticum]|uniref:HNH endonuclease n=1 Tax=Carnobacterium maltaromaticum TaxID=2751 RepID=UPI0039BEB68B